MANDYNENEKRDEVANFLEVLAIIDDDALTLSPMGKIFIDRIRMLEITEAVGKKLVGNNPDFKAQLTQERFMLSCALLLLRSVSFFLNKKWWELTMSELCEYMTKHLGGNVTKKAKKDIMDMLIETIETGGIVTKKGVIPIKRESTDESKDN